jgi:hypothetical protein
VLFTDTKEINRGIVPKKQHVRHIVDLLRVVDSTPSQLRVCRFAPSVPTIVAIAGQRRQERLPPCVLRYVADEAPVSEAAVLQLRPTRAQVGRRTLKVIGGKGG